MSGVGLLMHDRILGPFFFAESTAIEYISTVRGFGGGLCIHLQPNIIFQHDETPHIGSMGFPDFLNTEFPNL